MINTQYIKLNMTPGGVLPVLHCSQYDIGRPLGVIVYNGSDTVDLSQYTVTVEASRTDGAAIIATVTTDENMGIFATTATMTNKADRYFAQLVLVQSGNRVASIPFVMCVIPAAMDENSEAIREDASLFSQFSTSMLSSLALATAESSANSARIDNLIALQTEGSMQGSKITTFVAQSPAQYTSSLDWQSFSFCDYSLHRNTNPSMSVLDGLSNPVLLSAGAYVLASEDASITDEPVYVNLTDNVRFYNHGYLGADPTKRAVEIAVPKVTDAAGDISGMWLLFVFSVVSDVPVDLSELTDIRIANDGTEFPLAGDAVRGQVNNLTSALNIIGTANNVFIGSSFQPWESKKTINTSGAVSGSNYNSACLQFIAIPSYVNSIELTTPTDANVKLARYSTGNESGFIDHNTYAQNDTFTIDTSTYKYIRIAVGSTDVTKADDIRLVFENAYSDAMSAISAAGTALETAINAKYTYAAVIPDNTDYDTLTTAGDYKVTTSAHAQTMTHCPTKFSHRLIVFTTSSSTALFQLVLVNDSEKTVYIRDVSSTNWYKFITTSSGFESYPTHVTASNYETVLPDLNLADPNIVYSIAGELPIANLPVGNGNVGNVGQDPATPSGTLVTLRGAKDGSSFYAMQLFMAAGGTSGNISGILSFRGCRKQSGSFIWDKWSKVGNGVSLSASNTFVHESRIQAGTAAFSDMNDAPNNSIYQIDLDAVSMANNPFSGHSCVLITMSPSYISRHGNVQLCMGLDNGARLFFRYGYQQSSTEYRWTEWREVGYNTVAQKLPALPSSNGHYVLGVTMSNGTPTFAWESA